MPEGVYGTAWQVHGGGFYHVEKYLVAPQQLPPDLIWFQWEAYLTWVTGFGLMILAVLLARRRLPDQPGRPAAAARPGDRHFARSASPPAG